MPVFDQGDINVAALSVPDLYVQIVPPKITLVQGVDTSLYGLVGTASWGPVNAPTTVGDQTQAAYLFGTRVAQPHDLGTAYLCANYQGAYNSKFVRVTDGTDTAATIIAQTSITLTAKYTGSTGNSIKVTVGNGSKNGSFKVTAQLPGFQPEVWDNITGSGSAFWMAVASAINSGVTGFSGASDLIVATATGAVAPIAATYTLAGGVDGSSGVTDTMILGTTGVSRTGMYALEGSDVRNFALVDVTTTSTWAAQTAFAKQIGAEAFIVGASGEALATTITNKGAAGVDTWHLTMLAGDWCYINDGSQVRLVSPQGFAIGRRAALSPEHSVLNKPIYGVVATQRTMAKRPYTVAELSDANRNGIEIITNPIPAGKMFGCRNGVNTSSDPTVNGDNYGSMTNFLAYSINASFGKYVGKLQTPTVRIEAKTSLESWLQDLADLGMIGAPDGSKPYQVILGNSNNSRTRAALGYMQADVKVVYQNVIRYFLINLEGGQGVQINNGKTA